MSVKSLVSSGPAKAEPNLGISVGAITVCHQNAVSSKKQTFCALKSQEIMINISDGSSYILHKRR